MNTKQIIDLAYQFEIASIESGSVERNPYHNTIIKMANGATLWEVVNLMTELYVSYREQYEELERFANRVCESYDNMKQTIERQAEEIDDLKQQLFTNKDNPMDDLPF